MAIDCRALPRTEVVTALDHAAIENAWPVAEQIRAGVEVRDLADRKAAPISGFRNQIVGRIAERAFRGRYLAQLEPDFAIHDYHERGDNRDYGVERDGAELPINVKTASTLFRNAASFGLEPEDCIPISSYKALNAVDKVPDLVYVDLVDFSLRERADAVMDGLTGTLGVLWDLLSWYAGRGATRAQNQYVDHLFAERGDQLDALAPGVTSFRVISAKRVLAILRENPRRCPGLGVKAAGTGTFNAEVNVHVSVRGETQPWDDIADILRRSGVIGVLDLIRTTETRLVQAPLL